MLDKFTGAADDDPARKAAEQAIEKLRAGRKPVDDFKNLRKEVNALKVANESLGQELDDLKKRLDASSSKINQDEKKND